MTPAGEGGSTVAGGPGYCRGLNCQHHLGVDLWYLILWASIRTIIGVVIESPTVLGGSG